MHPDVIRALHTADRSGRRYPAGGARWRGDDGSPLMLDAVPGLTRDRIDVGERSLWRYAGAIPVAAENRVSLGEGWTPLVADARAGGDIRYKLEWFNPTSSFKDRGAAVLVSHLASTGAAHVLEDSSGNGGSALAAYAAAAGIAATIVVPARTSQAKVLQMKAFGAEIVRVEGTRDAVADRAVRMAADIPYASHNWHPMFLQGVKTIGYELWEQLGCRAPDAIVTVAGAGSIVLGCDIAFRELRDAGAVSRMPRLLVGQPADWASIVEAVGSGCGPGDGSGPDSDSGQERAAAGRMRTPTIADGAAIARPVRLAEVTGAVRRSGGAGVAVTDDQIRAAVRTLASRGLYAEPTSAVAQAALEVFMRRGLVRPDETTVVVLTGSGLKAADAMADVFAGARENAEGSARADI